LYIPTVTLLYLQYGIQNNAYFEVISTAIEALLDDDQVIQNKDGRLIYLGLWFKEDSKPNKNYQSYQEPITKQELKEILNPFHYYLRVLTN